MGRCCVAHQRLCVHGRESSAGERRLHERETINNRHCAGAQARSLARTPTQLYTHRQRARACRCVYQSVPAFSRWMLTYLRCLRVQLNERRSFDPQPRAPPPPFLPLCSRGARNRSTGAGIMSERAEDDAGNIRIMPRERDGSGEERARRVIRASEAAP